MPPQAVSMQYKKEERNMRTKKTSRSRPPRRRGSGSGGLEVGPQLGRTAYLDQKLYTGEPRLAHADGMAEILKGVRNDDELIVAAYLFSVTDCIHDADRWIEK